MTLKTEPRPDEVVYFYCSDDRDAAIILHGLINAFDLMYFPIRITDRKGDATQLRGLRPAFLYLHKGECSEELRAEIDGRAGPVVLIDPDLL